MTSSWSSMTTWMRCAIWHHGRYCPFALLTMVFITERLRFWVKMLESPCPRPQRALPHL